MGTVSVQFSTADLTKVTCKLPLTWANTSDALQAEPDRECNTVNGPYHLPQRRHYQPSQGKRRERRRRNGREMGDGHINRDGGRSESVLISSSSETMSCHGWNVTCSYHHYTLTPNMLKWFCSFKPKDETIGWSQMVRKKWKKNQSYWEWTEDEDDLRSEQTPKSGTKHHTVSGILPLSCNFNIYRDISFMIVTTNPPSV